MSESNPNNIDNDEKNNSSKQKCIDVFDKIILPAVLVIVIVGLAIWAFADIFKDDEPKCIVSSCGYKRDYGSKYCVIHRLQPSYNNPDYSSPKSSSDSKSKNYKIRAYENDLNDGYSGGYDPYDVDDYDDPDDFAEEWAEEFGDGDFEEGYEEAYDYWEDMKR